MTRLLQHWPRKLGTLAGAPAGFMVNLASTTNQHMDWFGRVYVITFGTLVYAAIGYMAGRISEQ